MPELLVAACMLRGRYEQRELEQGYLLTRVIQRRNEGRAFAWILLSIAVCLALVSSPAATIHPEQISPLADAASSESFAAEREDAETEQLQLRSLANGEILISRPGSLGGRVHANGFGPFTDSGMLQYGENRLGFGPRLQMQLRPGALKGCHLYLVHRVLRI